MWVLVLFKGNIKVIILYLTLAMMQAHYSIVDADSALGSQPVIASTVDKLNLLLVSTWNEENSFKTVKTQKIQQYVTAKTQQQLFNSQNDR